ncbi:MAG: GNAT family N-acetyltransferase [Clostridia bacterium]|nr:GNAT family N-acetyltransferase [Clostridia bacterium]
MIRLFTGDSLPTFDVNWQSTYIISRFLAYGGNAPFAPFYMDENDTVLSVLSGDAVLYATHLNIEEWACFLAMHPDITTVTASWDIATSLADTLQKTVQPKKVMRLQNALSVTPTLVTEQTPRQIYPLLKAVFGDTMPAFDDWYVDVSHRLRHNNCTVAGVSLENEPVSTAMTVAQSADAIVIGAVATSQKARKRGYAAQCIGYLADKHKEKTVMISPKNSYAEHLYTNMGFVVTDTIGQIYIRKED